jgi:crotonobetainyl-CoA:carnitine CoA-transferase CaiB-like acyl-CoA transferase
LMKGDVPRQAGNNHPTGAPTGAFRTRDGYINIAPTPPMWRRFCAAIGRADMAEHPDFATPQVRRKNRETLNAAIEAVTVQQDSAAWIETLNKAGIPCGPIYGIDQAFGDPQVKHLGIAQEVVSKALGAITLIGQPVSLSRTPSRLATAAPEYGEHNDAVLSELGYSAAEIGAFRKAGAI